MSIIWEFLPIITLIVVYLLVSRIGAILLTHTGLDRPTASFQALSALTGTGFTTRASEMIVGHKLRRRIVMTLMVIGNIGLAGAVVALIRIFRQEKMVSNLMHAGVLLAILFILMWVSGRKKFWRRINAWMDRIIENRSMFRKSTAEELLSFHDDFSIVEIQVQEHDSNIGKPLRDTDFRTRNILVLSIEREDEMNPLPNPDTEIKNGDKLICYGNVENIADNLIQL